MVSGLSGMQEAGRAARAWHEDAKLYAIATAKANLGPDGRASAWLYSYASPSSDTFASFLVRGSKVERVQQGRLPKARIRDIVKNALPPENRLMDSTEAIKKAAKVRDYLQKRPGTKATGGLDSFSTRGKPAWIFTAIKNRGALEQKIPALKGSS